VKKGDMVMFTDKGVYSKWFFGHLATVVRYTVHPWSGNASCRVQWLQPVPYHDDHATISDFSADKFKVV